MTGVFTTRSRTIDVLGHRAFRCIEQCQSSRRLLPIRGEERSLPVMEFFLQGMTDMLHNKRRKSKGEKRVLIKDLHARNYASESHRRTQMNTTQNPCPPAFVCGVAPLLVGFLANESRDVEIINARTTHHRPREIVGRPGYETWRRRGNRRCRSGRRN